MTTRVPVRVSAILSSGERAFRLGRDVAYGTLDGPSKDRLYSLVHAPSQGALDRVADALEYGAPIIPDCSMATKPKHSTPCYLSKR